MRTVDRLVIATTVLAIGAIMPAVAQEPPAGQDVIAQLQAKSDLTEEDQAQLRQWLEQQVQAVASGDPAGATKAVGELRKRYEVGTERFKNAFAELGIQVIGGAYKQAQRDAAAQLLAILTILDRVSAYPLLIEALGDQRVPVRTVAAIGLRRLRSKLAAAGGDTFTECINALREAGRREESPVTLQLIYRAMDYSEAGLSSPNPKLNAAAVLELLEARAAQYARGQAKAEGADTPGLQLASGLSAQLDEQERSRLVVATAKMLRYGVERYTGEFYKVQDKLSSPVQIARRNRMELFIIAAEKLLAKLTAPEAAPTVAKEMQQREEADKVTYLKIEWNKWADLLQQRYQVDVHIAATEDVDENESDADESPTP